VPKLLAMLSLKGAIVTADAINCQRAIAAEVVGQGGQGNRISKQGQDLGEVGIVPCGPLDLTSQ
jgi:predicted transposase YbfD/YdcC